MKLNKKIATIVLSSIAATSLSADITLGSANGAVLDGKGLTNYQTTNVYNLWANPAAIVNFEDTAVLGLSAPGSGTNGYFAGSTYSLGKAGVLGLWSGRANTSGMSTMLNSISSQGVSAPKTTDIFYGVDLGFLNIGTRVSLATSSKATGEGIIYNSYSNATNYKTTSDRDDYTMSEIGIEVGASLSSLPISTSVGVHMPHISSVENGAYSTTVSDGFSSINNGTAGTSTDTTTAAADNLNISAQVQFAPKIGEATLITTAYYMYAGADATKTLLQEETASSALLTTTTNTTDLSTFSGNSQTMGADLAVNISPMKKTNVVLAIGYNREVTSTDSIYTKTSATDGTSTFTGSNTGTDDTSKTKTTTSVPVAVSFEQNATAKVTYRVGGTMNLFSRVDETTITTKNVLNADGTGTEARDSVSDTTNEITTSVATIHLGLSYRATKDLALHLVVNKDILLVGPDFVGGTATNLSASGAITYQF